MFTNRGWGGGEKGLRFVILILITNSAARTIMNIYIYEIHEIHKIQ